MRSLFKLIDNLAALKWARSKNQSSNPNELDESSGKCGQLLPFSRNSSTCRYAASEGHLKWLRETGRPFPDDACREAVLKRMREREMPLKSDV